MAGAGFKTFTVGEVLTSGDVNTYLMQQSVMVFADSGARGSALGTAVSEGMLSYLSADNAVEVYDGSEWSGISAGGYTLGTVVTYTSSGTFVLADYPYATALLVEVQGGGGGGAGNNQTGTTGEGGSGGGYARSFITNLAPFGTAVTVTVGAGGAAGTAGGGNGGDGGDSSFGTAVYGYKGLGGDAYGGGTISSVGPLGGTATGDVMVRGGGGHAIASGQIPASGSGSSYFSNPREGRWQGNSAGIAASGYGGGGTGGNSSDVGPANRAGGAGSAGIVIVHVFAGSAP